MNKEINFGKLPVSNSPKLITLPAEHITRNEKCSACKASLIETFQIESSKPKDIMKVPIGRKFKTWLVSDDIYCPTCKMKFKHSPTTSDVLGRYKSIVKQGGIYQLSLYKDFLISQYDTPLKRNLKKGTIVYATISGIKFSQEKLQMYKTPSMSSFFGESFATNFLYELKKGYKKSTGWITRGQFVLRKQKAWTQVPAILCVMNIMDLFTSDLRIVLPASNFVLPKEILKK